MAEIGISVASKIAEYLVAPAMRNLRYAFCFGKIVEDFRKQKEKLAMMQERLQYDVIEAKRQTQDIERDVEEWLTKANAVLDDDVKYLEKEIEANKRCCFTWCPDWSWRFRLSKMVAKKILSIVELQETSKFERVGHFAALAAMGLCPSKDFVPSLSSRLALDAVLEALKEGGVSMVGVYGMGGVGKTTLVKVVGNEAKESKLFDLVVMAVVSRTPDVKHIQGQIADLLSLELKEETLEGRAERLKMRLIKVEKILIILDDVWKELDLAAIGIPYGEYHTGCKIVLTTRRQQVCTCMGTQKMVRLDVLTEHEAWDLFQMNACLNNCTSSAIVEVAVEVAKECRGLPIAIVTLGRALRGGNLNEWKAACRKLKRSRLLDIENVEEEKNAYMCLKLSYDHLRRKETKICFLMCSLFPEDYIIPVEKLVEYAWGINLYKSVHSIEEVRSEVFAAIDNLKASSLLLDFHPSLLLDLKGFIMMHDMVRDVALWISSKEESFFMIHSFSWLKEWPRNTSFEPCTAISLLRSSIESVPEGLVCPNLEILLLSGHDDLRISKAFFDGMKVLKVFALNGGFVEPEAFQSLTNLRTLQLKYCNFKDISSLGNLKKLEILKISGSDIKVLPNGVGELNNLRLLDVSGCAKALRVPPNVIRNLSQLEELYYCHCCAHKGWETKTFPVTNDVIEEANSKSNNASLLELCSLSRLTILSLQVQVCSACFPLDFVLPKLQRFEISINTWHLSGYHTTSKRIRIVAFPLDAFKELFCITEDLYLESVEGAQNLVPSFDGGGLNELSSLQILSCPDMEFLIDQTQPLVPAISLSNLLELSIKEMISLRQLCNGQPPNGFLQKLENLTVGRCNNIISAVPFVQSLKKVTIEECSQLQEVFEIEASHVTLASGLTELKLELLPELRRIWREPTNHVSLQSLKVVEVRKCRKLPYLFSPSLAQSLVQIETLEIHCCYGLEKIINDTESDEISSNTLSKLESVKITDCPRLEYIFPISLAQGLSKLKVLHIADSPRMKQVFGLAKESDRDDDIIPMLPSLQDLNVFKCPQLTSFTLRAQIQSLYVSEVGSYNTELREAVSPRPWQKILKLECLTVGNCEVVFHLQSDSDFLVTNLERVVLIDIPSL
ncbi:Disease resistance protein [Corchorus capsularis]|uniref:Disease resistance protein n=1 Tax=Corchorus capsularis TaxID=210143 RepID=A0A1R3GLI7_COCAP|nr:Disease resistance protein [Corchorus capsularis]